MNLRALLAVYAVLSVVGGILWLLVPNQLVLYGITPDGVALTLSRYAGASVLGLGLIAWGARRLPAPAIRPIVLGITVANAASAMVCLSGALSGDFNEMAWLPTSTYTVFTLLFLVASRTVAREKAAVGTED